MIIRWILLLHVGLCLGFAEPDGKLVALLQSTEAEAAKPEPDLAKVSFDLAAYLHDYDRPRAEAVLEEWVAELKQGLPPDADDLAKRKALISFANEKVPPGEAAQARPFTDQIPLEYPESRWLYHVLLKRKANCMGRSTLYLVLGREIGLEIQGVVAPGHVCVLAPGPGGTPEFLETTDHGKVVPKRAYEKLLGKGARVCHYRGLSPKEFISDLLSAHLGYRLNEGKRYAEAERAIQAALRLNPSNRGAFVNLGRACRGLGKLEEAVRCYDKTLSTWDLDMAWYNRGNALQDLEKLPEAATSYRHALRLNPECAKARSALAKLSLRVGDISSAFEARKDVVPPFAPSDDARKALRLDEAGKSAEAIPLYKKAIAAAPKDSPNLATLYLNLGNSLSKLKRTEEALKEYQTAARIDPAYVKAWTSTALAAGKLKKIELAADAIRQAKLVGTHAPDVVYAEVALAMMADDIAKAIEVGEAGLKRHVDFDGDRRALYSLKILLVDFYLRPGPGMKKIRAVELVTEQAEAKPNDLLLQCSLAAVEWRAGLREQADQRMVRALRRGAGTALELKLFRFEMAYRRMCRELEAEEAAPPAEASP